MTRRLLLIGALLTLPLAAADELLRTAEMKKPVPPFSLHRDLFQGIAVGPQAGFQPPAQPLRPPSGFPGQVPPAAAEGETSISEEIYRSIGYAGYATRLNRRTALLNISGDFQLANEGDMILERFKVITIRADSIIIEYEGKTYEIRIAGDNNG